VQLSLALVQNTSRLLMPGRDLYVRFHPTSLSGRKDRKTERQFEELFYGA
jgi:hypothetical protein